MRKYVANPIHFAAECACQGGECTIVRENILFLDDGIEQTAIDWLQGKCGHIVIIPDTSGKKQALLYHTSCDRMTDLVSQIFEDALGAPASLPQSASEMSIGELYRRDVTLSYQDCKEKVESFSF